MIPVLLGLALALAELTGIVRDPDGHPVPNATILIVGSTAAPIVTHSDEQGRFRIEDLPEGEFNITVSSQGLAGDARVIVRRNEPAEIDITMRLSAVSETLVVSAAQMDQPLSRVADTVTVIDRHEIEARQLTSIGEALASVPGFTVVRSGGPGTVTSAFPRGGESDFTLVLVDGIRENAFGGGLDLSQVPMTDIERIEVVRGPQSALHGSDAIGGVVQIITRRGGAPTLTGRVEGGSRETRRAGASTVGELAGWTWQAGGDYFADEGFTGIAPANGERVSNDDAVQRDGWLGSGYRFRAGTEVAGTYRHVATERGAPGPFGSDPGGTFDGVNHLARTETRRRSGGLRLTHPWGGPHSRVRQRVEFDHADFDLTFLDTFGRSEGETTRTHGRVQTDAAFNRGVSVSGGVEWLAEDGSSTFITDGLSPIPVERRVIGTFGEARWHLSERVTLQGGVRAEHITREALAGDGFSRPDFAETSVTSVNPKVAAAWLVSPTTPAQGARQWTRVRASAGTGIRPPDIFEIAFTDNPDLKPERSRSVEVGVTQALAAGALTFDATTFYNDYDDLIVSVGGLSDVSRYRTDNVSNARARGIELTAAWRSARHTLVRASYTFLDAEIRAIDETSQAPPPFRVGDRLLRRPTHQGSLDVTWTPGRASVFARLGARGRTLDAEPSLGPGGGLFDNPGYAVFDAGGSWRLARGVTVYARVLNLFDRSYEEVLGYPAPGRTAFAGVRLAASR
jgi:outer membrane cobalamin receptor